ncbi:MAG TPA: nucleotide pyrophosphohydrolase [Burkholderiales bacterium]|nr:nucleotide pyrophosphohydrolase [Burkholderiales bacterium]
MEAADSLEQLRAELARFAAERDWDQFHNPKNLAMALVVEAGELVEHFQWLSPDEAVALPSGKKTEVAMELADVLMYLLRLADKLDVDLIEAASEKLQQNRQKYPVEKARGRATKYDQL